mgnify:CR=1 FL=1
MCGIFALLLKRPLEPKDIELGRAGIAALRHRGPRGSGEWYDAEAGGFLGHTRLATFDPTSGSDQPMVREKDCIAFNGEILNFKHLREKLEPLGVPFHTTGDTEVLLQAIRRWGDEALDLLDGPFAFIHWDGRNAYIATDHFGDKPLFLAEMPEGIYVCSELQPLAQLLRLEPKINSQMLAAFLALGYIPPPATAFPTIKRILQATRIEVSAGQIVNERRYWRAPQGQPGRKPAKPLNEKELDRLCEAIVEGLALRVVADVPLCLFLSSGVDSALVASLGKRELGVGLDCYTMSFPGSNEVVNEGPGAKAIATALGLDIQVMTRPADIDNDPVDTLLDLIGQPFDTGTTLAFTQMSKVASETKTVALTGIGADEICMGFGKNAFFHKYRHAYALPEVLRLTIGGVARQLERLTGRFSVLGNCVGVRDHERYLAWKVYPAIAWLREVDGFAEWAKSAFGPDQQPLEAFVRSFEINMEMPGSRAVSVDVGTMRSSLGTRTPFFYRKVAETVAQSDPRAYTAFGQKSVLRRLLARYLPQEIIDHGKRGFVLPSTEFSGLRRVQPPALPGISSEAITHLWNNRDTPRGWQHISRRILLMERFLERYS